jgi:hypothetical protein
MKKITPLLIATSLLFGCGADNNNKKKDFSILQDSYAVQSVASDYSSSQVAIGSIIGDRSATQGLLTQDKSDFTISTYENNLYHIGRRNIDTISRYETTQSITSSEWTYGTNYDNEGSANTKTLVQQNANNGYLIRYGSNFVLQVDPSAVLEENFVKAKIDLSAYTFPGAEYPRMKDAVIANNKLFVAMQRLDNDFQTQQAYIAVIDLETNTEIDTDPQQDGLQGIPLNATNTFTLVEHNGQLYAAGRGGYNSDTGGLDKIDASTYAVTPLIDENSFPQLIDFSDDDDSSNDRYYHVLDVAVVSDQLAYAVLNIEMGYTTVETKIAMINPSTQTLTLLSKPSAINGKEISDINIDANDRLWLGIANANAPGILVMDTDTNTISGDFIPLDMPAQRIEFLTVQ